MSVIIMILLLSFLILVHELGHFLAAKSFGIAVPRFGFGLPIGPTLFKKQIGETEFVIHAFLLGGYVSFIDDEENTDIAPDSPLRFENKPVYQRAIVISAGVFANFLAAILLVILTATIWHALPSGESKVFVNKITATPDMPTYQIGLKENDLIYKINNTDIKSFYAVRCFIQTSKLFNGIVLNKDLETKMAELKKLNPNIKDTDLIKPNTIINLPKATLETPVVLNENNLKGFSKKIDNTTVLSTENKTLRDKLYKKEKFVTDKELRLKDIALALTDTQAPINITVMRDNKEIHLKPLLIDITGIKGIEYKTEEIFTPTKNIKSILTESWKYIINETQNILLGLKLIFTGQIAFNDLHSIIVITKVGADIINAYGLMQGLLLTAIISINLTILNILPIPALDGGHLLFLLIEKIRRRPLDKKILENISKVFFTLLLILIFFLLINDIHALITHKF